MKQDITTLAFLGDAVYELYVRRVLAERGSVVSANRLHHAAVRYVKAQAQARAVRAMIERGALSEAELDLVRRARNRKPKSFPKNADPVEYKLATAFEALLGFHDSGGRSERVETLIALAIEIIDGEGGNG